MGRRAGQGEKIEGKSQSHQLPGTPQREDRKWRSRLQIEVERLLDGVQAVKSTACHDGFLAAGNICPLDFRALHVRSQIEAQTDKKSPEAPLQEARFQNDRKHLEIRISLKPFRHARILLPPLTSKKPFLQILPHENQKQERKQNSQCQKIIQKGEEGHLQNF